MSRQRPERDYPQVSDAELQEAYEHAIEITIRRHDERVAALLAESMVPLRLVAAVERPLRVVQPREWSIRA